MEENKYFWVYIIIIIMILGRDGEGLFFSRHVTIWSYRANIKVINTFKWLQIVQWGSLMQVLKKPKKNKQTFWNVKFKNTQ